MDLLAILSVLRRRRLAVGLGAVLAAVVALQVGFAFQLSPPQLRPRQSTHGVAWTRMLVDTPTSQLLAADPPGRETLQARAGLLVDLATTEQSTDAIAREAQLPVGALSVADPSMAAPVVATQLPTLASEAATPVSPMSTVGVSVDALRPIIVIRADAPDTSTARALVDATTVRLQALTAWPVDGPAPAIAVERLAPTQALDVVSGRGPAFAMVLGSALFTMWCMTIVMLAGALRVLRARPAGMRRHSVGALVSLRRPRR